MKKFSCVILFTVLFLSPAFGQDTGEVIGQISEIYTGSQGSGNSLMGGFSGWGLMGGILFSGIGFVAFVYGKKNAEWKPMVIGILLLCFPYAVHSTILLYAIGTALTASLYYFRE